MRSGALVLLAASLLCAAAVASTYAQSPRTVKPVLHGRHWVAITGKPLATTAGALVFATWVVIAVAGAVVLLRTRDA